jgi:hypothetical protein
MTAEKTGTTANPRLNITYRTAGGAAVSWREGTTTAQHRWNCGGCAESGTGGKSNASDHAKACHAEGYTYS